MSELGKFLEDKQREVLENEKFLKWNKNNKLTDENGEPLIVFHGSISEHFDRINPKYYQGNGHVFGGFYASSEIKDVNNNYAGFGIDVINKINNLKEDLSVEIEYTDLEEIDNEIFNVLNKEKKERIFQLKDEDIEESHFKELKLPLDLLRAFQKSNSKRFNKNKEISKELHFSDLITAVILEQRFNNMGFVLPVFMKMEKPCYIGFGGKYSNNHLDTRITILEDYDEISVLMEIEKDREREFSFFDELNEIKMEVVREYDLDYEEMESYIKNLHQCSEITGEEFFDTIVEIVEMKKNKDPQEKLQEIFQSKCEDIIEFDEDGYVTDSLDGIYISESILIDEDSEEFKRGKEFITNLTDGLSSLSSYYLESFYESINDLELDEDRTVSMTDIMNKLRFLEREPEVNKVIYNSLSKTFDGIVMNAYEANDNNWFKCFDEIDYDTIHYISFNEYNVKNALYNNGDYNMNIDNMIERRGEELLKMEKTLSKSIAQKHIDHLTSRWKNAPTFKLKKQDFFKTPLTDAMVDLKTETVFINEDRMTSKEKLEKTIIHETVGHFGLRKFVGNKANNLLNRVSKKYTKELKELNIKYPELDISKKEDKLKLAEEFIAFESEKLFPNDKFLTKAKNKIKEMFIRSKNKIGFKLEISDDIFLTLKDGFDSIKKKKKKSKQKRKIKY